MKHGYVTESSVSFTVMNLGQSDVPTFVSDCVRERSLSKVIATLNHELLHGTPAERAEARKALKRLGFL